MTMTDDDLEAQVREMLQRRAADITEVTMTPRTTATASPLAPVVPLAGRHRRGRLALAGVAAAMVAAVIAVTTNLPSDDPAPDVFVGGIEQQLEGVDLETAAAVFRVEDATADEVAIAYLTDRLAPPSDRLVLDRVVSDGDAGVANWRAVPEGPGEEGRYEGEVHLRRDGIGWAVVAAFTDGVDLSGVVHTGMSLSGTVRSTLPDGLVADVVDFGRGPVPGAPHPEGLLPNGLGTAGVVDGGLPPVGLDLEIPVPFQPVVLQVRTVGGAILSISELALDPPPHLGDAERRLKLDVDRLVAVEQQASDATHRLGMEIFGVRFGELGEVCERSRCDTTARSIDDRVTTEGTFHLSDDGWLVSGLTTQGLDIVQDRSDIERPVFTITADGSGRVDVIELRDGLERVQVVVGQRIIAGEPVELAVPPGLVATKVTMDDGRVLVDLRQST
jgi:hypothetical protein